MTGYDSTPHPHELHALSALLDAYSKVKAQIETLETSLTLANAEMRVLLETEIPELMDEIGVEKFKAHGVEMKVEDNLHANLSKERLHRGVAWLDANKHGGIVKRKITVEFNREQEAEAKKLLEKIRKEYPVATQEPSVHQGTLKKWVRGMVEREEDFPKKLFGVFERRVAKIIK